MGMRALGGLVVGSIVALLSGAARAQVSPPAVAPFGARGQFVLLGGSSVGISSTSWDASGASSLNLTVEPELDYFVARNVSLGLDVGASASDSRGYGPDGSLVETHASAVYYGARVGFNLPFGGSGWSWYPRLAMGFEGIHRDDSLVSGQSISSSSPTGSPSTQQRGLYADLYAPLLFRPVSHFFVGFGPEAFHDFASVSGGPTNVGGQRTTLGAGFVVGGYWGGFGYDESGGEPGAAPPEPERFGERGELVLTNALVASVSSTGYAGTSSSSLGTALGGSVDYFPTRFVSLGVAAAVSSSGTSLLNNDGTLLPTSRSSLGGSLAVRLGVNLPIARWLSFYPLANIGFEAESIDTTYAGPDTKENEQALFVGLFAPLLVHPAEHFFVGFGPSISHDLSREFSFPLQSPNPTSNRSTSLGAGLVLGGWLPCAQWQRSDSCGS
jgi:hypothetical protein